MPTIFRRRWKGNLISLHSQQKPKTDLFLLRSYSDWTIGLSLFGYAAIGRFWKPDWLRKNIMKIYWSGPGMFLSDSYDSLRFRYKAWKYGGE